MHSFPAIKTAVLWHQERIWAGLVTPSHGLKAGVFIDLLSPLGRTRPVSRPEGTETFEQVTQRAGELESILTHCLVVRALPGLLYVTGFYTGRHARAHRNYQTGDWYQSFLLR